MVVFNLKISYLKAWPLYDSTIHNIKGYIKMPTLLDRITNKWFYEIIPAWRAPLLKARLQHITNSWRVGETWVFDDVFETTKFLKETEELLGKYLKSSHFTSHPLNKSSKFINTSFSTVLELTQWLEVLSDTEFVPNVTAAREYRDCIKLPHVNTPVMINNYFGNIEELPELMQTLRKALKVIINYRENAKPTDADWTIVTRGIHPLYMDLFAILTALEITLYGQRD